jgi:hypothetical protein
MSATTAQILLGYSHPNDCGLSPTHAFYLHEGDKCAWSIHRLNLEDSQCEKLGYWFCAPSQIMADALLLAAFYAGGQGAYSEHLLNVFPSAKTFRVGSFELALTDRLELLDMLKKIPMPKMVVSIFQGSSLKDQTRLLAEFPFDCEVCESVSYRIRTQWNSEPSLGGEFAEA